MKKPTQWQRYLYEATGEFPDVSDVYADPKHKKTAQVLDKAKKIKKVRITDEWRDDHLPCYNLEVEFDSGPAKISVWWADPRTWYQAEAGKAPALKAAMKRIADERKEVTQGFG